MIRIQREHVTTPGLITTRGEGQSIVIELPGGGTAEVFVHAIVGGRVQLRTVAPGDVIVDRSEVFQRRVVERKRREAAERRRETVPFVRVECGGPLPQPAA